MAGALVVKDQALLDRLYFITNATGNGLNPWESFLLSRGLKTLDLRVRHQCQAAAQIAAHLAGHPQVQRVLYPGLPSHPGHEIAQQQMDGLFGAMLSVELTGGFHAAKTFVEATQLFQLADSLGAVESLIEQPASMSHASYAPEERAKNGTTDGLVRLSVGLEDVEDLIADLDAALVEAAGWIPAMPIS